MQLSSHIFASATTSANLPRDPPPVLIAPPEICLGALVPKTSLEARRAERVTNVGIAFRVHDAVKRSRARNIFGVYSAGKSILFMRLRQNDPDGIIKKRKKSARMCPRNKSATIGPFSLLFILRFAVSSGERKKNNSRREQARISKWRIAKRRTRARTRAYSAALSRAAASCRALRKCFM